MDNYLLTIIAVIGGIWTCVQIDSKLRDRKEKNLELINELLRLRIDHKREDYNRLVLTSTHWKYRAQLTWSDTQDPIKHIYAMQQYTMSKPHLVPNSVYQLYLKSKNRV